MAALNLVHEGFQQPHCNLVGAFVVVAVPRKISLYLIIDNKTLLVPDRSDLCVLYRAEGIHNMRESCNACCERAAHVCVDKRHLRRFIIIFVVHVMDKIESIHIKFNKPVHHSVEFFYYVIVIQHVSRHRNAARTDLFTCSGVNASVEGVEQTFGKVRPRAEELHLLAGLSCGNAAAYAVVVAPYRAHHTVVLILNRRRIDRNFRGVLLEILRKSR